MPAISSSAHIYPNVRLGSDVEVGEFSIIGVPGETLDSSVVTVVGDRALIRSHTVVYAGNRVGAELMTGHGVIIREYNEIGDSVKIGTGSIIEHHIVIGDGVHIHSQAFVPEYSIIEERAWLGPRVCLTNAKYPASKRTKEFLQGPLIGRLAKIGANATVLPGIKIGEEALIGAGAVVTQDVPAGAVVVGNPARVINSVDKLKHPPNAGELDSFVYDEIDDADKSTV